MNFEDVKGLTFVDIQVGGETIYFTTDTGRKFKMHHHQDCCEDVYVESVVGDVNDLLDTPILMAEETCNSDPEADESGTWTFYKLSTAKGYVDIRWYGSSNGYYSESVAFDEV